MSLGKKNIIRGTVVTKKDLAYEPNFCEHMRRDDWTNGCGLSGKHFRPRSKSRFERWIECLGW